jgi:hypothetical protein
MPASRREERRAEAEQRAAAAREQAAVRAEAAAAAAAAPPPPAHRVKRTLLVLGSLLASMNIWTGAPLLAVWVGSHAAGKSQVSMGAILVVVVVLVVLEIVLVWILSQLNHAYEQLSPRPEAVRRTSPWLRSMRGEREDFETQRRSLGAMERILIVAVALGVGVFELWFFFLSGSSIGSG